MNLLTERLPGSIVLHGRKYPIETDFRLMVRFELLLTEDDDDRENALLDLFTEMFGGNISALMQEGFAEAVMQFYACGKDHSEIFADDEEEEESSDDERVYSFRHDSGYIYAAFLETYGIDLAEEDLHWWQFRALFNALSQNCLFSRILSWRSTRITNDMTEGQRDFYRRMKRRFALPRPQSERDKEKAIADALMNGGDLTGVL